MREVTDAKPLTARASAITGSDHPLIEGGLWVSLLSMPGEGMGSRMDRKELRRKLFAYCTADPTTGVVDRLVSFS